jgi:signal-transduction protein with cAMP-binding, CBS, and nucleotidyltransferase domain
MANTRSDHDIGIMGRGDEGYFDEDRSAAMHSFDVRLLHAPVTVLGTRSPLIFAESAATSEAMRAMQAQHRGCVLVTGDGDAGSPLTGIFTERDILLRVINRGRNPAEIPLGEVMSRDPEHLQCDARVAWVLNLMSVGGFRHVPLVNVRGAPAGVISVRDVVEFLVESFPSEILNLPPDFGMEERHPRDGG